MMGVGEKIGRFVAEGDGVVFAPASEVALKLIRPSSVEGEVLSKIVGPEIIGHPDNKAMVAKAFGITEQEVGEGDVAAYYEMALDAEREDLSRRYPELKNWLARSKGYQVVRNIKE